MRRLGFLFILTAFIPALVTAQQLGVDGNSQIRGRLDLARFEDLTTVHIGVNAGLLSTFASSRNNTFTGYLSGFVTSSGDKNSFYGSESGLSNTLGSLNAFFGHRAGNGNKTGDANTYFGSFSGSSNMSGDLNTAFGGNTLFTNTGSYNTAAGFDALYNNTTGNGNTAVGYEAMKNNKIGVNNTAIGNNASFQSALGNLDNTTCVGYGAGGVSNNHNRIEIGNTSVSWIGGQVGWSTYSDARIKSDIREDVPGLSFVNHLRPVTYQLDIHKQNRMCFGDRYDEDNWTGKYDIEDMRITGFIAQEVDEAAKLADYNFNGVHQATDSVGMYSLCYSAFVVPLVKSVQELSQQNELLLRQNQMLANRSEKQALEIQSMKEMLSQFFSEEAMNKELEYASDHTQEKPVVDSRVPGK